MRRAVSIGMFFIGLVMVVTGVWNLFPPFDTLRFPPHIINSFAFGFLAIVHVSLNWKSLVRHFKGLGSWWILVAILVLTLVWLGVVFPLLVVNGVMQL